MNPVTKQALNWVESIQQLRNQSASGALSDAAERINKILEISSKHIKEGTQCMID